ncbi:hypothetical protein EV356DRAFT_177760 [Viridothelium virens]|uniref:Uncharacterized protein n=1 Tax=Viridothelium virens TaxID=1048519 RepID=A0A6A6H8C4_VIRVR|nr:hypothetical protein EV356DRAFT_177760 [Viridothelium virens]
MVRFHSRVMPSDRQYGCARNNSVGSHRADESTERIITRFRSLWTAAVSAATVRDETGAPEWRQLGSSDLDLLRCQPRRHRSSIHLTRGGGDPHSPHTSPHQSSSVLTSPHNALFHRILNSHPDPNFIRPRKFLLQLRSARSENCQETANKNKKHYRRTKTRQFTESLLVVSLGHTESRRLLPRENCRA